MASLGSMTLEEIRQLSISDLKSRLARHNVNVATCIEKEDLVRALHGALARKSGRSGRGNGGNDGDDSSDRKRKANEVITLDDSEDDEDSRHAKKHSSFKREFGHPQEPICLDSDSEDEARPRAAAARRRQGGNSINSIIPFRLCETATSRTLSASERRFFASMREMMGLKSGRRYSWLIICNYLIDFSYLFQRASPELLQFQRVVVFYGTSGQACPAVMRQWERLLEGTGRTVAFVQLLPSDPPNSRANPLPVKIEYGVHHTKMFLMGYEDEESGISKCHVSIHTSNILHSDAELKSQGVYAQDFPLKVAPGKSTGNPYSKEEDASKTPRQFEDDLVTYMESYRYQARQSWCSSSASFGLSNQPMTILQLIRAYDFSTAYCVLIPSVPGRHRANDMHEYGYLKLRKAVIQHARSQTNSPLLLQFSSLGSLNGKWLSQFLSCLDSSAQSFDPVTESDKKKSKGTSDLASRMKIVWPSVEEVRTCVEGYSGGGAIPGRTKNLEKAFLMPLYHRWSSRNPNNEGPLKTSKHAPHIKTFVQPSSDGTEIEWMLLGSHNLSIAALGQIQKRHKDSSEKILFIRHWELGVFISPRTLKQAGNYDGKDVTLVPYRGGGMSSGSEVQVPLPYDLNPTPYNNEDVTWAVDRTTFLPDRFGRII
mmetsp:Transcript_6269/g.14179  ORF Transcript_6269/g.14179 Transcript_6269/m.14179 type:complete len:655 (-) Transcript_6269:48-2012(-)